MDSGELSVEQLVQIFQNVHHLGEYLGKIERRMEVLGFPGDDELREATRELDRAVGAYVGVVLRMRAEAWLRAGGGDEFDGKPKRRWVWTGPHPRPSPPEDF